MAKTSTKLLITLLLFFQTSMLLSQSIIKKYEPVEGKIIGIWPHENRLRSPEKLRELYDRFGFNFLLVAAPYGDEWYESVKKSGRYDSTNIVKQIYLPDAVSRPEWFWNNLKSLGKVVAYYFDEPISREFPYSTLMKLIKDLCEKGYYPTAHFYMSEINEERALKMINLVDVVSYSGYSGINEDGSEQVKSWQNWQSFLGGKFSMLWMAAHLNMNVFHTLFKGAKELGINSIWLYQYEPLPADQEFGDEIIQRFCEAAVEYGFMKFKND